MSLLSKSAKLKTIMQITIQEIEKIADLARLELTEAEKSHYAEELSAVFSYMDMLNSVNTDGVAETCQVTGLQDVVRGDVAESTSLEIRQKLIAAFPAHEANLLKVQAVFTDRNQQIQSEE